MRRTAGIAVAVGALLALAAGPVLAQQPPYGGTTTTLATTTTSSTTSTTVGPTTTQAPLSGDEATGTATSPANPGDPVAFSTGDGIFEPGTTVDVVLVRGQQGADGLEVAADVTVNADGSIDATFTLPADTPPGIYFVYAEGVTSEGVTVRVSAVIVVLDEGQSPAEAADAVAEAGPAADDGPPAVGVTVTPPPELQQLQVSVEVESQLLEELGMEEDAIIEIGGGGQLAVTNPADDSSAAPIAAGVAAAGLVLAGAIGLRYRRSQA